MATYVKVEKVGAILSQILSPGYTEELQRKLEEEAINVPGEVPGDELKQAALILRLIKEDIEEPLRATCERLLKAVSALSSPPSFSEEAIRLAEGLSAILLAAGEKELAEQVKPVLHGAETRTRLLELEKQLEAMIDDLNLQELPGKCEEWQIEAHHLALEHLRDEYNIRGELTSSEKFWEVVREEVSATLERIIRELAFQAQEIGEWDPSWTCLENLPPKLRRIVEDEIR